MTAFNTPKFRRLLPATVILAGLGLASACSTTTTTALPHSAGPLSCDIVATQSGNMVNFQGRVQANESVSGTYSLTLRGSGANIRQGGAFSARAGETLTIGQANLSGSADRYSANMTLNVNGGTYNCGLNT